MDDDELIRALEEIGITSSEIKVYLALLELGQSTAGPIVQKSRTADSKIYVVLNKLIEKGLVASFKQEGRRHFKSNEPTQILRYLKEKQEQLRLQQRKVQAILPFLTALAKEREPETEAVVFRGTKGIRTAFNDLVDSLRPGDEVNIMGVHAFGERFKPLTLFFQKIRSQKKIKGNFLINKDAGPIADLFAQYPPLEIRFMEEGLFTPAIFLIYKDTVIINLADELVFFVLKSKRVATAFNAYFQHFWKTAERYV